MPCGCDRKGGQSANVSGRYGNFALCSVAALMIIELQQKDVAAACLALLACFSLYIVNLGFLLANENTGKLGSALQID